MNDRIKSCNFEAGAASEVVLPFAKSIDEITQTGFYQTPNGLCRVSVYTHRVMPWVKEYVYTEKGLAGIFTEDGRHYTRRYVDGDWTAWELVTSGQPL